MTAEDFLDSKLIELNIDHADEIRYGDMVNLLDEYSNIKAQELQDYILEKLKSKQYG